ncbi:MAG: transcriptional repressor NrdR [Myxococcales bacterium]|nr:transcriptional repressor NrdR [Myxococcales bacterium]
MHCPSCDSVGSRVVDSRGTPGEDAIRRRRECDTCGHRFTTYERVDLPNIFVIKKNGERELFERDKFLAGIHVALHRRPVAAAAIDEFVRTVETRIGSAREVQSHELGEMIMTFLRGVDHIGFVRFASVYREFKDIGALLREVASLVEQGEPK